MLVALEFIELLADLLLYILYGRGGLLAKIVRAGFDAIRQALAFDVGLRADGLAGFAGHVFRVTPGLFGCALDLLGGASVGEAVIACCFADLFLDLSSDLTDLAFLQFPYSYDDSVMFPDGRAELLFGRNRR